MSKPKFDPSKGFEVADNAAARAPSSKPKFNPDASFEISRSPSQLGVNNLAPDMGVINEGVPAAQQAHQQERGFVPELMDRAQTQLESFGNTISGGYLPHLQALHEKIMPNPTAEVDAQLEADGFKLPQRGYVEMRDENIMRQEAQAQRNPYDSVAGTVGGAVTIMPLMAGTQAVRGASGLSRLVNAAGAGFGYGAAVNPGDVQGVVNPLQGQERLSNAGKSAAFGGAAQGGGEAVAKIGSAVKNSPVVLDKIAKVKAFKAAGAVLKDFRNARGDKSAEEIGETLLKKNIVSAGDGIEEIAAKTTAAKTEAGQKIRSIYQRAKEVIANSANMGAKEKHLLDTTKLDGKVMSAKIRTKLDGYQKNNLGNTEVKGKMDEILTDLESMGDDIDLSDLLSARNSLDDRINYAKKANELPLLQKQMSTARQEITKMIQNRVRAVGAVTKDSKLINELREANKDFGQLSTVERFAKDRISRNNSNNFYSLGDNIQGGAGTVIGVASGDTPEERLKNGILGYVGGRVSAKYGRHSTALAAKGAQKLGEALKKPANFAKYGEPLIEAAKKSPDEFQALLQQFANDPGFQKLSTAGAN